MMKQQYKILGFGVVWMPTCVSLIVQAIPEITLILSLLAIFGMMIVGVE